MTYSLEALDASVRSLKLLVMESSHSCEKSLVVLFYHITRKVTNRITKMLLNILSLKIWQNNRQRKTVDLCSKLMVAVQTVNRLVAAGSLSAGGDRAGGPRGWRRRRRAARERARKRRAAGARADPPRAFHEVDARRGPAETDPGPRASRARTPDPLTHFPISPTAAAAARPGSTPPLLLHAHSKKPALRLKVSGAARAGTYPPREPPPPRYCLSRNVDR